MYRDVFAQFNSDFGYLVDAVENRGLKTRGTSELALARFHNRVAGAIHRAAPGALVTVAAHSMPYTSDAPMKLEGWRPPARNLYSDAALVAAGGDEDGTLDFYQVHSYPNWQDPKDEFNSQYMPFLNPKTRWQLDKPLLVGEFWDAIGGRGEGTLSADAWYKLFADGYAGGLGWAYFEVTEEFGGAAIVKGSGGGQPGREPRRVVAKHQMRDRFAPLIREVARRLAEDRAREVETALVAPKGMPAATFAALRGASGLGAGASSVFAGGAGVAGGAAGGGGGSEAAPPPHSPPLAASLSSRFASSDAIAKPRGPFKASSSSSSSSTITKAPASATSDAATSVDAAVPAPAAPAAAAAPPPPLLLSADVAAELAAAFSHAAADAARTTTTGGALSSSPAAPKVATAAATVPASRRSTSGN